MYWALKRYDHVPAAHAARLSLVEGGRDLMLFLWRNFHHVCENANAISGVCEDVSDADPLYSWGPLMGLLSFLEAGYY